jgi:hypothetical protein
VDEIHISDVRTYKQCRRKWNWSSPLRRNLEPNVPYAPFFSGRLIHHCLEHYYRSHTPFTDSFNVFMAHEQKLMDEAGKLWPAEAQIVQDQLALCAGMLNHYALWIDSEQSRWSDDNLEFITLEESFSVPFFTPSGYRSPKIYLGGRRDGLVRRRDDGTYWIWEVKTTRSIDELRRSLDNDEQAGTYLLAAQIQYNVKISGVLYNILRKKLPTIPDVLKSGFLTKRMDLDTTAQAYADAVKRNHPGWTHQQRMDEYGDIIRSLLDKGNTFFARIPIYRSQKEISELAQNLRLTALEMTRKSTPLYPAPSWMNCNFCHFRGPCLQMNAGGDTEFLLAQEYRTRKGWESLEMETKESDN